MPTKPFPFADATLAALPAVKIDDLIRQYEVALHHRDTAAAGYDVGFYSGEASALETVLAAILAVPKPLLIAHNSL